MKGVYELKPSFPKYVNTWDVNIVLHYLENMYPHDKLSLKQLSLKLVTLIALLSGQRCRTVHKLSMDCMQLSDTKCVFQICSVIKQTRKGNHLAPIELLAFAENEKLCVIKVLEEYIKKTRDLRKEERRLFVSYQKPHGPVSKDTIARWIRDTLTQAGIDTGRYGAHSTRSASTSAAAASEVPVTTILKAAGWSAESTFTKFYKKTLQVNMGHALLDSYLNKH